MPKSITSVGLDVHKGTVAVALAEAGLRSEPILRAGYRTRGWCWLHHLWAAALDCEYRQSPANLSVRLQGEPAIRADKPRRLRQCTDRETATTGKHAGN